jgi:hypothetical protein
MSRANPLEVVARFESMLPHVCTAEGLLVSSRNEVLCIPDLARPRPIRVAKIPWAGWQSVARLRLADRVLKCSIYQVLPTLHGLLVATGFDWWRIDRSGPERIVPFAATRPMHRGLCTSADGRAYIAEYTLNPHRRPVHIYESADLRSFTVAWRFPSGRIRHVHALLRDPSIENRIWVLTGDHDEESGIFFTDDGFSTVHPFAVGDQQSRATDLAFRDGHLLWGMDAPDETPYVVRAARIAPRIERLAPLPGPAYYMSENEAGGLYLGTTAEPGRAVRDRRARVFRILPDHRIQEVLVFERDLLPQHGIVYFPRGCVPHNFVVYTPRALRPQEGWMTIARDRTWG